MTSIHDSLKSLLEDYYDFDLGDPDEWDRWGIDVSKFDKLFYEYTSQWIKSVDAVLELYGKDTELKIWRNATSVGQSQEEHRLVLRQIISKLEVENMEREYISGRTRSELYKFLKDNGGSYNDLAVFFQSSGIQAHEDVESEASSNKYQFLDKYIKPLNLEQLEDAQKLASFIEQVAVHPNEANSFDPVARDLLASLQRDGWGIGNGTIRWRTAQETSASSRVVITIPSEVTKLLETLITGLPRAMHPLKDRRKNLPCLAFDNEYDVQDLLHSMLRLWINDIRPEDYLPSHAGSSTRVDFLLAEHAIVIETKYVRDRAHAKKIGDELIIDIEHYKAHCRSLWIVIYDPQQLIRNPGGLISDLERQTENLKVRVFVIPS